MMTDSGLHYFTHMVDGAEYGAWFRVISSTQIEVIGVGMLESQAWGGFSPESSARSILENFVRTRRQMGAPVPSLASLERQNEDDHAEAGQRDTAALPTATQFSRTR